MTLGREIRKAACKHSSVTRRKKNCCSESLWSKLLVRICKRWQLLLACLFITFWAVEVLGHLPTKTDVYFSPWKHIYYNYFMSHLSPLASALEQDIWQRQKDLLSPLTCSGWKLKTVFEDARDFFSDTFFHQALIRFKGLHIRKHVTQYFSFARTLILSSGR